MQMNMAPSIDPSIEVGTVAGTLRVAGEELVRRIGDLLLTARLADGCFVFSGGLYGEHALDAHVSITSAARLIAHWRGYCENTARCHLQTGGPL